MASIGSDQSSFAIGFTFPILGGICVALRFYSRWHLKNALRADDWLCIPAWLCVTGTCASLLIRAFHDKSPYADPVAEQRFTAQILAAFAILWAFANTLIKLSILSFYRRVFVGRAFSICSKILMGLSIIWLIYDIVGWLLYCGTDLRSNFEGPWDNCPIWGFQLQIGVFALDSFIDFFILVLPIYPIWKLQLGQSKKVVIVLIFLLGGFAFFASVSNTIVQGIFLVQPSFAEDAGGGSFFQGASILIYNWPAVEVGVGLITCNLPSLSFRVLASLSRQLKSVFSLSLSRLRDRSSAFSLKSSAPGRSPTRTPVEPAADPYDLHAIKANALHSFDANRFAFVCEEKV